ncbi:MAG: group 1 truncated hemoglobin [Candidatus Cloacimonetes bacterium]|nr:group 1 truncated hemoglobin [Candidatus Cloacimonadota bacterium]
MTDCLLDRLGGKTTLKRVHKIFYDRLFEHDWLKKFFLGVDQTVIENQQSDFMSEAMGGPKCYSGKLPIPAHKHMFITDELFTLRHNILRQSILDCGISSDLCESWLKIDKAFRSGIVKPTIDDCQKRYKTDSLLVVPKP